MRSLLLHVSFFSAFEIMQQEFKENYVRELSIFYDWNPMC